MESLNGIFALQMGTGKPTRKPTKYDDTSWAVRVLLRSGGSHASLLAWNPEHGTWGHLDVLDVPGNQMARTLIFP